MLGGFDKSSATRIAAAVARMEKTPTGFSGPAGADGMPRGGNQQWVKILDADEVAAEIAEEEKLDENGESTASKGADTAAASAEPEQAAGRYRAYWYSRDDETGEMTREDKVWVVEANGATLGTGFYLAKAQEFVAGRQVFVVSSAATLYPRHAQRTLKASEHNLNLGGGALLGSQVHWRLVPATNGSEITGLSVNSRSGYDFFRWISNEGPNAYITLRHLDTRSEYMIFGYRGRDTILAPRSSAVLMLVQGRHWAVVAVGNEAPSYNNAILNGTSAGFKFGNVSSTTDYANADIVRTETTTGITYSGGVILSSFAGTVYDTPDIHNKVVLVNVGPGNITLDAAPAVQEGKHIKTARNRDVTLIPNDCALLFYDTRGDPLDYQYEGYHWRIISHTAHAPRGIDYTMSLADLEAGILPVFEDGALVRLDTSAATSAPEMAVSGNSVEIADGDSSPDAADHTDFGSVAVGQYLDRTYTITNSGSVTLFLSGTPTVAISGTNKDDFGVVAQPSQTVAAGATTTFTVRFTPAANGTRTAAISIANNDAGENPYNFSIQGSGVVDASKMVVTGGGVAIANGDSSPTVTDGTDFGVVSVATSQTRTRTFKIRNIGSATLNLTGTPKVAISGPGASDFTVTAQPSSQIASLGETAFTILFDPSAYGERAAIVSIDNDGGENPYTFLVQGTGAEAPDMVVSGDGNPIANGDATPRAEDFTDFGTVATNGAWIEHTFVITNNGSAHLTITGYAVSGTHAGNFDVNGLIDIPGAWVGIPPGDSTYFYIRFTPTANGTHAATIELTNDDTNKNPYTFAVQGFGSVGVPEMVVLGNNTEIADADNTPSTSDWTDFGSAATSGGSVTRTFTIRNDGDTDLTLSGTPKVVVGGTHAGDFTVTQQPTSPVAAGATTTFLVRFDPSATGTRSATLSIANDDADENPYNFSIQGTGIVSFAAEINVTGNGVTIPNGDTTPDASDDTYFGSVEIGDTLDKTFTIQNLGGSTLNLTGSPRVDLNTFGGNPDYTVTVQPAATVAPGGSTTFTIRVSPAGLGGTGVTVSIASDDSDENPYRFIVDTLGIEATGVIDVIDPTGLVAFWRHDTSPGLLVDSSGNSKTLTNNGSVATTTGKFGQAASLDGTNYLSIASDADIRNNDESFTFACWFKLNATGSNQAVAGKDDGSATEWLIWINAVNQLTFYLTAGYASAITATEFLAGSTWYCVIGRFDRATNTMKLTLNGTTETPVSSVGTISANAAAMELGTYLGGTDKLNGLLDHVIFQKRYWSDAECTAFYNSGAGVENPF